MTSQPLRILIADDSVAYRRILTEVVTSLGEVHIIGTPPKGPSRLPLTEAI